jgi:hypothetical protein
VASGFRSREGWPIADVASGFSRKEAARPIRISRSAAKAGSPPTWFTADVASGFRSREGCLTADVASGFSRKEAARPFQISRRAIMGSLRVARRAGI